jgi:hypothetical protein
MNQIITALGFIIVLAVAVLKLVQLLQWVRCRAVVTSTGPGFASPAQRIPITYQLRDGTAMTATLRLGGRRAAPSAGDTIWIIYDPADPAQIEWAVVIAIAAAIALAMLAGLIATLVSLIAGS